MTKTEMLSRLKKIHQGECRTRGLFTLIQMLIHYFTDPSIPEYEFNGIFDSLPKHVVRAVDILRTSKDPKIEAFRKSYSEEMERDEEVPSLTEIEFGGLARTGLCLTISHDLSKLLLGEDSVWLEKDLYAYFTAQDTVVMQMIHRFDLTVYQQGLCVIIDDCKDRGMAGQFGTTSLRSYVMAGRLMFTLARRIEGETVIVIRDDKGVEIRRLPYQERSVSFVGEDGKKSEPRFGLQSMYADLVTTMGMFEDITNNWPKDNKEQKKVYKADKDVGMM
jgi:hypothetical protein